jgi:hypothetical protein
VEFGAEGSGAVDVEEAAVAVVVPRQVVGVVDPSSNMVESISQTSCTLLVLEDGEEIRRRKSKGGEAGRTHVPHVVGTDGRQDGRVVRLREWLTAIIFVLTNQDQSPLELCVMQ